MRRQKSLRIGVHHADAAVWGPVYRTHLSLPRRLDASAATTLWSASAPTDNRTFPPDRNVSVARRIDPESLASSAVQSDSDARKSTHAPSGSRTIVGRDDARAMITLSASCAVTARSAPAPANVRTTSPSPCHAAPSPPHANRSNANAGSVANPPAFASRRIDANASRVAARADADAGPRYAIVSAARRRVAVRRDRRGVRVAQRGLP